MRYFRLWQIVNSSDVPFYFSAIVFFTPIHTRKWPDDWRILFFFIIQTLFLDKCQQRLNSLRTCDYVLVQPAKVSIQFRLGNFTYKAWVDFKLFQTVPAVRYYEKDDLLFPSSTTIDVFRSVLSLHDTITFF